MAQFARPISPDIAVNSWTTTPLYEQINETTYSDTDYIQYNSVAYCEVTLGALSDPESSSGHYVRYRLGRSRTDRTLTIVVRLMQGASEIASWTHVDPAISFQPFEQTLTTGQADAISNYSGLSLRFDITAIQNSQVYGQVSWAEMEVPDASTAVSINKSETVTVSDTPGADALLLNGSVADGSTISDTPILMLLSALAVSDNSTVGDITIAAVSVDVDTVDNINITDTPYAFIGDINALTDDIVNISDIPTVTLGSLEDLTISIFDSINLSDTPNVNVESLIQALDVNVQDSIYVVDIPRKPGDLVSVFERITVAIESIQDLEASVQDSINVSDSTAAEIQYVEINVYDNVYAIDNAAAEVWYIEANVSDNILVSENVDAAVGQIEPASINVSDGINISENVLAKIEYLSLSVQDAIGTSENTDTYIAAVGEIAVSVSDTVHTNDAAQASTEIACAAVENILISENVDVSLTSIGELDIDVFDGAGILDNALIALGDIIPSATDSISITEQCSAEIQVIVNAVDVVTLSDSPYAIIQTLGINILSNIGISDSCSGVISVDARDISESININEDINAYIGLNIFKQDSIMVVDLVTLSKIAFLISVATMVSITERIELSGLFKEILDVDIYDILVGRVNMFDLLVGNVDVLDVLISDVDYYDVSRD